MKKDNKRMKKTTYIKRVMAIVLSAAMLISMTPEVFAETLAAPENAISESAVETTTDNTQSDNQSVVSDESTGNTQSDIQSVVSDESTGNTQSDNQSAAADESTGNTESDNQSVAADESTGTAGSDITGTGETESSVEQTEESITEESAVTEENDSFTDGNTAASEEETTEMITPYDAASEGSTREGESSITSPSLTLDQARNYTVTKGNVEVKVLELSNDILTVDGAAGLILLSNIQPQYYSGLSITLKTTSAGWDVTQPQVYTYTVPATEGEESGSATTITSSFLGLGNAENPYAGTMTIAQGSEVYSITANRALFNAISTDATLPLNINFMMVGKNSGQIVLADQVIKGSNVDKTTLKCNITLTTATSGEVATSDTIGGIIGTLKDGVSASVTLTNNLTGTLTVSGGDNRGLFCNTMNANSFLTASLTNSGNATITVTATSGDAGGYVGKMSGNNTLTISGKTVNTVTSNSDNAGGLVGSAADATINVTGSETFDLSNVAVTAANNKSAGGLVGEYTNTTGATPNLAQFTLNTTLSGGSNSSVGSVFGALTNSGSYTISGKTVSSSLSGASGSYGGVIGKYEATTRNASLTISSITDTSSITSTGGNNAITYGGMIGTVSGSSYVEIENVIVSTKEMPGEKDDLSTSFGGLVGKMENGLLNVGSVTLKSNERDIAADKVKGRGGLVGYIDKGILRLHGTTDFSGQTITTAYHHTGQIVGNNGNGLVYATGTGSDNSSDNGWTLKRYTGTGRSGSDIGNWGEVVRLSGTLTEGDGGLLTFDSDAHTVTVKELTVGETTKTVTLSSVQDFAAYALAFNLNSSTNYADNSGNLIFNTKVDPSATQTVNLSNNVNLSGTGILGIGRDDNTQTFSGTFDGKGATITLDIGGKYGDGIDTNSGNGSGQIYAQRNTNVNAHYSLGLFPKTDNATISNLKVDGNVGCTVVDINQDGEKHVYVAAVIGNASGNTSFHSVEVLSDVSVNEINEHDIYAMQGGFVGMYSSSEKSLSFTSCTWNTNSEITNKRSRERNRVGGLVGKAAERTELNVANCNLNGSIKVGNAWNGGLGAEIAEGTKINISNLVVDGERVESKNKGGLLGYRWYKTNVTFSGTAETPAVTVKNSSLNTGDSVFGGLVYWATGYWNATAKNSIVFTKDEDEDASVNTFTGKSNASDPSGLLVGTGLYNVGNDNNALYLEVGTWGNATDAAYKIEENAVTLTLGGSPATSDSYFDELVGTTIKGNAGHDNAVVSLAVRDTEGNVATIDNPTCNTYTSQLGTDTNFKNGKTRYYYNLDSYRTSGENGNAPSADSLDTPGKVLSWSVFQYAASNIRDYFCKKNSDNTYNAKIYSTESDGINLTGYSYYPVSPLGTVTVGDNVATTLTFAYEEMNGKETGNKPFSDSTYQHYLMHHGLLYNTSSNVTVTDTMIKGTVGLQSVDSTTNSGALIFGSVTGDLTQTPNVIPEVSLNNVTLEGLRVAGVVKDTTTYAPLLINKITQVVKLNVNGLSTGEGYVDESNDTAYAGTSLIGKVGSETATKLTLTFFNIALDARKTASDKNATSVQNNGTVQVKYNTTHTIFTRATLLESFQYTSLGSGVYNFNSDDQRVTYGREISNTGSGRNLGEQYQYYDNDAYVWDGVGETSPDAENIKTYYTIGYLPYVGYVEGTDGNHHELDINLRTAHLDVGCGTYGHPYQITEGRQLTALANFLSNDTGNKWVVRVNKLVYKAKKQETVHAGDTTDDVYYMYDNGSWYSATKDEDGKYTQGSRTSEVDTTGMRAYLRNAYYQICKDINITSSSYVGLGDSTTDKAFSGVVVGKARDNGSYPTVYISIVNSQVKAFGGLVCYSQGSVVKNLKLDYTNAKITMTNSAVPSSSNNPFFGGVVGYCMGGDTIVDNVSVNYGENSVTLSSTNGQQPRLIAAGGYVGLVGGAKETGGKNKDYEKTGGGVVFRNMGNHTNNFASVQTKASDSGDGATYFYCNPYVGRVLDGYACYDGGTAGQSTLNNTDKNYTIPDLVTENSKGLTVTTAEGGLTATVASAQGLWLLSAIVNSGAGAMDDSGKYTDTSGVVDAYQYGKPRSCDYGNIGSASANASDIADETHWGGVETTDISRVSYLVKQYTGCEAAAKITGGTEAANNVVTIEFTGGSIDMSAYGNGFRGIGGSYGFSQYKGIYGETDSKDNTYKFVMRRSVYASAVNGENSTIKLAMSQKLYRDEVGKPNENTLSWPNQGAGLFVNFGLPKKECEVSGLTVNGMVDMKYYALDGSTAVASDKIFGESCAGGFAAKILYSTSGYTLTFNGLHLGGNSEATKLTVSGAACVGGALGTVAPNKTSVVFVNTTAQHVTVSTYADSDSNSGGLIGYFAPRDGGQVTIKKLEDGASTFSDINISLLATADRNNRNYAAVGGLIAKCETRPFTINDVTFSGSISGTKCNQVGGLVGCANGGGTISNCIVSDLTVSNTDATNDARATDSKEGVGGLVGYSSGTMVITNTEMKGDTKIYQDYSKAIKKDSLRGALGGMIGRSKGVSTITGCRISGTSGVPVKILTNAYYSEEKKLATGGLVGFDVGTTITNTTLSYVNILASSVTGGLVGHHNTKSLSISNCQIQNCNIGGPWSEIAARARVGLVAGSSGNVINGYNILAQDTTVGISTEWKVSLKNANVDVTDTSASLLNTMTSMGSATMGLRGVETDADKKEPTAYTTGSGPTTDYYVGTWVGYRTKDNPDKNTTLVAVACKDCNLPWQATGSKSSYTDTFRVTYADYPVDQNYKPDDKNSTPKSAAPWLDVNPKSNVTLGDGTVMTGNGVGYLTGNDTTLENSVAYTILTEAESGSSNRSYCNLPAGKDTDIARFLPDAEGKYSNDVYLTTYQTEEKDNNTSVPSDTNFPILVVSGLAKADEEIWNYIAALTNIQDGDTAKGQADKVTAATYQWGSTEGGFVEQGTPSLSVDNSNKITIAKNTYDNQKSQFTLLTVKYDDPTDDGANAFHLYVPVLVKKVLYTSFSVKFLAGTNYRKDAYDSAKGYATAGFDETVTAYIEYNYDRSKSDWEKMLENGDDLLWYYNKVLDLAKNTEDDTPLPDGTRLTLVDKKTGQCYIHTFQSTENVNQFDLSTMTLDGSADTAKQFKPVPICDLLELTIDGTVDATKTKYVSLGGLTDAGKAPEGATVKVGNSYYRKATDEEIANDDIVKYTISVGDVFNTTTTTGTSYLEQGEGYYLTIQVPSNSGKSVINNTVNVYSMKGTGAPLASIQKCTASTYVIYDGVRQSEFAIRTSRNGDLALDTKMEDGDSIQVTLTSTLSLTDSGKEFFSTYAPTELDHRFNINMKKHLKTETGESVDDVVIGATGANYTYTITQLDGTELVNSSNPENNSEFLDTLTIDSASNASAKMIDYLKNQKDGVLTITAVITLPYPTLGTYFPGRSTGDEKSGISVSADSRVANATTQLPITIHKETLNDSNRYFTENSSFAKLTYNTYDGDGTGDTTRKLGINPSDTTNDLDGLIYTNGVYDYSGVDADTLSKATYIKYTLELFQKDNNGSYNEGSPLGRIDEYLSSVTITGEAQFSAGDGNGTKTLIKEWQKNDSGNDSINIKIKPLTGSDFEVNYFVYANYKVRLTAVLLKEDGTELTGTKASDYIIYTNARIYQGMIQ